MTSCGSSFPLRYFSVLVTVVTGVRIRKDEMGGTCNTNGRYGRFLQCFHWKNRRKGSRGCPRRLWNIIF